MRKYITLLLSCLALQQLKAQDSTLLNLLNDSMSANAKTGYVTGTFKANHIVNMQTVESAGKGDLNFVIQHRFGQLNSGSEHFFWLGKATLRHGVEYGITDSLTVGYRRSS